MTEASQMSQGLVAVALMIQVDIESNLFIKKKHEDCLFFKTAI